MDVSKSLELALVNEGTGTEERALEMDAPQLTQSPACSTTGSSELSLQLSMQLFSCSWESGVKSPFWALDSGEMAGVCTDSESW